MGLLLPKGDGAAQFGVRRERGCDLSRLIRVEDTSTNSPANMWSSFKCSPDMRSGLKVTV
jgi:hypothetical protein